LVSFAGLTQADETTKQKWAVLVGVNDYADLNDLRFCKNDATALAEQLVKVGFPRDNVFLLTDGAADAKDLPTKANIEARIKNVLAVAEEGQLVLLSFSGHGVHLGGKTYLCPTGARASDPEGTMIQLRTVYDTLNRCKASRKLFWVDACRDDPHQGGSRSAVEHAKSTAGVLASLKATPEGILTFASCATGQTSWQDEEFGHGVFMHYLLEGLSGKADREVGGNRNNRVSLLELYGYANINTRRFVLRDKDRVQTPELFGRITGDFDIAAPKPIDVATDGVGSLDPHMQFLLPAHTKLEAMNKCVVSFPGADLFEDGDVIGEVVVIDDDALIYLAPNNEKVAVTLERGHSMSITKPRTITIEETEATPCRFKVTPPAS
jgi:hypothetical protein